MPEQNTTVLPLQGKRILVTRTRQQAGILSTRLQAAGAIPIELPTIRIVPPQNWEALDTALRKLFPASIYSWVIFTSANGVTICCDRLLSLGYHPHLLNGVRVAAIGPVTAAALAHYCITADLVPREYIAEGVAAALKEDALQRGAALAGQRILLPRAAEARKILVTELQQAGAVVDEVAAYATVPVASDDEQGHKVWHLLQTGQIDIITFTSSSTVRSFMQWLSGCASADPEPGISTSSFKIACIGPITSQTARELGLQVLIEAQEFTIDGLVEAIIQAEA